MSHPEKEPATAGTDAPAEEGDEGLMASAERLAADLWNDALGKRGPLEKAQAHRVERMLADRAGLELVMALTDEVLRIHQPARAAEVFRGLAADRRGQRALGPADRASFAAGARLAERMPEVVVPLIRQRVRSEMAGVILPAGRRRLALHAARRHRHGIRLNVNVLGEAVLGEDEAERRLRRVLQALSYPSVDYVSVKISSIASQLDVLRFDHEVERIAARLRRLYRAAAASRPAKFVNLDMEEYRDLDLTLAVFKKVLDEDAFAGTGAGIVLQAYLPDSLPALVELCEWARARHERSGGWIKVRLVKGANLAMEHVDAEVHGWELAPFGTKDETDANYKRLLDVTLDPANDGAVRVGVASHNPFEVAWASTLSAERGAGGRLEIEMLEGMAPSVAAAAAKRFGGLLLYAPIVESADIESAIAYLVRRLDENTGPENFLARQFGMTTGSPGWDAEAGRFRRAVRARRRPAGGPRRRQDRSAETAAVTTARPATDGGFPPFANEPDTDFTRAANRKWAAGHLEAARREGLGEYRPVVAGREVEGAATEAGIDPSDPGRGAAYRWLPADLGVVNEAVAAAREAGPQWAAVPPEERRRVLLGAADALARARGRLLGVMAVDTGKTVREGDPEVSEAIDFATYYAAHIPPAGSGFRPYGTVVVASPWNFPLSIPAGGVLAALAAGNAVILKPARDAVAVGGEIARALWEGGVPRDVLQFLACTDRTASRQLIVDPAVDAVVLTGSWDTSRMFLRWRPDLRLHAETSGKNAIVVTATADLDEAIADIVKGAFGHAGQKCSAASLAIVEAPVYDDPAFLRRLADAVRTLTVGPSWDLATSMGPLIHPPEPPLLDALTRLAPGERWLVEPRPLDEHRYSWSPGVKLGVAPGSEYHLTEYFGPVLGVLRAKDLEEAIALQNQVPYGLTAGLHALDPAEISRWREAVAAGNLYVNRGITGAIVRRQPFGGWKRSVVGPGAKAGGPQYVASLGHWPEAGPETPSGAEYGAACQAAWQALRVPRDETGLAAESNVLRYRPLHRVLVCTGGSVQDEDISRALAAATAVGVAADVVGEEDLPDLIAAGATGAVDKIRFLGGAGDAARLAAVDAGVWTDDVPVAADPAREVLRWAREQAVSESRHRHGNVTRRRPGLAGPVAAAAETAPRADRGAHVSD